VNRLAALVLTHANADYAGGAVEVLRGFRVDEIWLSPYPGRSPAYEAVRTEAAMQDVPVLERLAGEKGEWGGGVVWEILYPDRADAYRHARDGSLVVRVARDAWSVLLMGGAGAQVEKQLAGGAVSPGATVLVVGDEGAPESCADSWITAVDPGHVVFSVNGRHPEGYPDPAMLDRVRRHGVRVWRTDWHGDLRFRFPPGLHPPAGRPEVTSERTGSRLLLG
jgi:competence protein ComEC